MSSSPGSSYMYGIDPVRFFAALGVAGFHLTWHIRGAATAVPFGWIGVEIFFVISGLVIANSAQNRSPMQFAVSRFLRLYPGAWCVALISVVVVLLAPAPTYHAIGIYAGISPIRLMSSLVLVGPEYLASAYWTLPIELAFYTLVFLILFTGPARKIVTCACWLILLNGAYLIAYGLQSRGLIHFGVNLDFGFGLGNATLLRHGLYFALGVFIWYGANYKLSRLHMLCIAAGVGLSFLEIYLRAADLVAKFAGHQPQSYAVTLFVTAALVYAIAVVVLVLSANYGHVFPQQRWLRTTSRTLGLMTYPFYLLHETVGGLVLYKGLRSGLPFGAALALALFAVGIAAFGVATVAEPRLRHIMRNAIGRVQNRLAPAE